MMGQNSWWRLRMHHRVALLHADGLEVVGGAIGVQHHAAEVVLHHIALGIGPQKGLALGILRAVAIHHVIGKVEGIGADDAEILVEVVVVDKLTLDGHIFVIKRLHKRIPSFGYQALVSSFTTTAMKRQSPSRAYMAWGREES